MADSEIPGGFPSPTALRELGDEELVRCLVRGHSEAMTVLFDRHYAIMMRVALRILRNRAEAEDIVQVAFLDFYRQVKLFDGGKGNLRSWLLQYIYGRSLNRLKELKVRRHSDHVELSDVSSSELATPGEGVFDLNESEARRLAQQVLGTLNENKRRIVELVCYDGMSIPEVAALTHQAQGKVHHLYYRAIEKMRASVREAKAVPIDLAANHNQVTEKITSKVQSKMNVGTEEVEIG